MSAHVCLPRKTTYGSISVAFQSLKTQVGLQALISIPSSPRIHSQDRLKVLKLSWSLVKFPTSHSAETGDVTDNFFASIPLRSAKSDRRSLFHAGRAAERRNRGAASPGKTKRAFFLRSVVLHPTKYSNHLHSVARYHHFLQK